MLPVWRPLTPASITNPPPRTFSILCILRRARSCWASSDEGAPRLVLPFAAHHLNPKYGTWRGGLHSKPTKSVLTFPAPAHHRERVPAGQAHPRRPAAGAALRGAHRAGAGGQATLCRAAAGAPRTRPRRHQGLRQMCDASHRLLCNGLHQDRWHPSCALPPPLAPAPGCSKASANVGYFTLACFLLACSTKGMCQRVCCDAARARPRQPPVNEAVAKYAPRRLSFKSKLRSGTFLPACDL